MSNSSCIIKKAEQYINAVGEYNCQEIEKIIKECSLCLRTLNKFLKEAKSNGEKHHLANEICLVQSCRTKLKLKSNFTGKGVEIKKPKRQQCSVKWEDISSAFQSRIRTGAIINLKHKDPIGFLDDCKGTFNRRISNIMKQENFLKINTVLCAKFMKMSGDKEIEDFKYIKTKNKVVTKDSNLNQFFEEHIKSRILKELEEFQERDSGWSLKEIVNLTVNINKYIPQVGSSYIELPKFIENKKACVNVKNNDNHCFAWAVISALYPANENPHRLNKYPHYSSVLNLKDIAFPVTRPDIKKFESLNNISINVYELNKKKTNFEIIPSRLTKEKRDKHVNLLLIQNFYSEIDEKNDETFDQPIVYHYVWIKNISRLLSSQLSKHKGSTYFCDRCLHYFHSKEKLNYHVENCIKSNNCKINFPPKDTVKFENYKNKEKTPFIVYADFECILKPININKSNTQYYQQHEAYSVGYYLKCSYNDSLSYYKSYRGLNCAGWFAKELQELATKFENIYKNPKPMKFTAEENKSFYTSTVCHICGKKFTEKHIKVRDHCHLTGNFRGAAHNGCNINYKNSYQIPVIFHNLSKYDAHLLIKDVSNIIPGQTKIIPNNTENYISIIKFVENFSAKFIFLDSFRFMASSLDKLASYLKEKEILYSEFPNTDIEKLKLLSKKGIFPYEYLNMWEKLEEKNLPPKEYFYNSLRKCHVADDDYEHAKNVWNSFNIENLGEYSDLYLKTDVLLLADVFENFRKSCIDNYDLDPAHYYTAPGLAWDALLKHTTAEIELIKDVDILMFIEKGIRGGLTQCSKRYVKANNKYMPNYDNTQNSSYLMYYDINGMYSWAMTQYLPYKDLGWVENLKDFDFNVPDNSPVGYILEVDLEYPNEIHNKHRDLPMAPEKGVPPGFKGAKMLATLYNKKNYVVHYRNLKQYLNEGLKLVKIHRALTFKQTDWMRSYIELNATLRKNAKNEFEKNLFKLMCNAVFGKTMENVRLRRDIKLTTSWQGRYSAESLISKPNFYHRTIFDENLVAIELLKTEILFNKPIYVGMAILDISKTLLYEFHYKHMIPKYEEKCNLCYTDTDSLIYEIKTEDIYEDMKLHLNHFDTSDYPANNVYNIPRANKKILGLMKDENNGMIMLEFVGLRAKMYALKVLKSKCQQQVIKKAKGVKSAVLNREITFDDYKNSVEENQEYIHSQSTIRSDKHILYSTLQTKITLSPFDNKRYLLPNTPCTLPWGHCDIMEQN